MQKHNNLSKIIDQDRRKKDSYKKIAYDSHSYLFILLAPSAGIEPAIKS